MIEKNSIDICDYIDSQTIRQYLRNIDYMFAPDEAAYVVWQSNKHSMSEKHGAWKQIIGSMKDVDLRKFAERAYLNDTGINSKEYYSLHNFLRKYIETENRIVGLGTTDEEKTVFSFETYYENDRDNCIDGRLFSEFEKMCEAIEQEKKSMDDFPSLNCVYIKKQWIDSGTKYPKFIELKFTNNMKLYDISDYSNILTDTESDIINVFEEMWFGIPTPFQKGDILCENEINFVGKKYRKNPFVLEQICYWGRNDTELEKRKRVWGATDMTACGYFQNDNGHIFGECMENYLRLEYYDKELKGAKRMLKVLSNYLKGNIPINLFMNAYGIILNEEQNKKIYDYLGFDVGTLKRSGLK